MEIDEVNHFMCETGAAINGVCGTAIKGEKTGEECDVDEDCETNSVSQYTECKCTNNEDGLTYCGPGRGNTEWINAKNSVFDFFRTP